MCAMFSVFLVSVCFDCVCAVLLRSLVLWFCIVGQPGSFSLPVLPSFPSLEDAERVGLR